MVVTEYPKCLKLKEKRIELGLSQRDLAMLLASLGLATFGSVYISRFECGLQRPWKGARQAISKALKVQEEELFPELATQAKLIN
jgi:transcriptional regulator with XRE-family HTH domain